MTFEEFRYLAIGSSLVSKYGGYGDFGIIEDVFEDELTCRLMFKPYIHYIAISKEILSFVERDGNIVTVFRTLNGKKDSIFLKFEIDLNILRKEKLNEI
jgi:hypothetical protein